MTVFRNINRTGIVLLRITNETDNIAPKNSYTSYCLSNNADSGIWHCGVWYSEKD